MKTISIESTRSVNAFPFKSALALFGQWFGAFVAFLLSMIVANLISPIPQFIMDKRPVAGFMTDGTAMLFNGAVNATILIWAARRSSPCSSTTIPAASANKAWTPQPTSNEESSG